MRFCGSFSEASEHVGRTKQRPQAHAEPREGVGAALLAVDDADRRSSTRDRPPHGARPPRRPRRPIVTTSSTRQTRSPGSNVALEPVRGAVLLRLSAHDQERHAARRATWPRRAPPRLARARRAGSRPARLGHRLGEPGAEPAQQLRVGLEAVLVEVVRRAPARAEHEVALRGSARSRIAARSSASSHVPTQACASDGERVASEQHGASASGAPSGERNHRAVLEVEVDPLAPLAARRRRTTALRASDGRKRNEPDEPAHYRHSVPSLPPASRLRLARGRGLPSPASAEAARRQLLRS